MYVCRWHLDVPYGKQADAVEIMQAWKQDAMAGSGFKKARDLRLLAGHVGASASHLIAEYAFENIADWEAALSSMNSPVFEKHSKAMAGLIVPGSQHWEILRVMA